MSFKDDLISTAKRTCTELFTPPQESAEAADLPACDCEELESRTLFAALSVDSGIPLATPTGTAAAATAATAVRVSWASSERAATRFNVYRSDNGGEFQQIGLVGPTLRSFTDSTVSSNHSYSYKVEAFSSTRRSELSAAANVTTPLRKATALTAQLVSGSGVNLSWTNNDADATALMIMRSTDGRNFTPLETVDDEDTTSYLDETVLSGTTYTYSIVAMTEANTSGASTTARSSVPLSAPSDVQTSVLPKSVALSWSGLDPRARNYVVTRSTDGRVFTAIATLGASANSFTDTRVATGTSYIYQIRATNTASTAGISQNVTLTTPLLAPSAVAASIVGPNVSLSWTDGNRAGVGFAVLRSSDGENFTQIAQVASKKFVDTAADRKATYTYQVRAVTASLASESSNSVSATTPDGTSTVTISPRYGQELVVTTLGASDAVTISQSGQTITIAAGGQSFTAEAGSAGLFVYDRAGSTSITLDASVTIRTTIMGVGLDATSVTSAGSNVSVWIDSTDAFSGSGTVHRVSAFAGGVTKAVGASLANPRDSGAVRKVSQSLWGAGPDADDVNQGQVGDCYFLSSLSAFADTSPSVLLESAVDMGDGTYAVQFTKQNRATYVRVNNALPSYGAGFRFAQPGESGATWAMVMEKAFAYWRKGLNTYASISGGWMGEVYSALGVSWAGIDMNANQQNMYSQLAGKLADGKAVTFGTNGVSPNLVRSHAYSLVSVNIDGSGNATFTVRNPWGVSGNALENGDGYATLSYNQLRANFVAGVAAA